MKCKGRKLWSMRSRNITGQVILINLWSMLFARNGESFKGKPDLP